MALQNLKKVLEYFCNKTLEDKCVYSPAYGFYPSLFEAFKDNIEVIEIIEFVEGAIY